MITELETINKMLGAAGLAPVADMNIQHPSYKKAKIVLDDICRTVQMQGYWFNRAELTLRAGTDGRVIVPAQFSHVNTLATEDADIVKRGDTMYDKNNRTNVIGRDLDCTVVETLPFEALPEPVATYVSARCVHEFYLNQGGQDPKLSEFRGIRMQAEIDFKKECVKNHRPTQPSYRRSRYVGNPMRKA